MKRLFFSFLLLIISQLAFPYQTLTDHSRISILTCGAGDVVYEKFGHSAIRVCDDSLQIDWIFHYGIFDFESDYFIAKFVKGETDYSIGLARTDWFVQLYAERGSWVKEQVLSLDLGQRQQIYNALQENYRPENRLYRYNFVFDNCATRPYKITHNALTQPTLCSYKNAQTYREIIHDCIGWHNWTAWGIAFVLGSEADQPTQTDGSLGFPFCMSQALDETWLQISTDTIVPFVAEKRLLTPNIPDKPIETTPWWCGPTFVFALLLILGVAITIFEWRKKAIIRWFDITLYIVVSILGLIIFYLMAFSEHPLVNANWNLLWANPLWLLMAIAIIPKKQTKTARHLAKMFSLLTICALIVQFTPIQTFHYANCLLVILLIIRTLPKAFCRKSN